MGSDVKKQFMTLAGYPLFFHALRRFDQLPTLTELILVTPSEGLPKEAHALLGSLSHPVRLIKGGVRRQDSVAAALAALEHPGEVVMVHDGARPFPPLACVEELARTSLAGGGLLATRATDTVKVATPGQTVSQTLDREAIWLAQTPQAIRADLAPAAHRAFADPDQTYTDEASYLETQGIEVTLVASPPENFKVTYPSDLLRAEAMLSEVEPARCPLALAGVFR